MSQDLLHCIIDSPATVECNAPPADHDRNSWAQDDARADLWADFKAEFPLVPLSVPL